MVSWGSRAGMRPRSVSTMMLANKLDQPLARQFPGAARAADFYDRCIEAGTRLAMPTARPARGRA
jgi:hypothetical protein